MMNYLGDGELFLLLDGQNVQYLCNYGAPSFLGIATSLDLITNCAGGICQSETPRLAAYDGNVRLTDLVTDGCFVRHVETTKSLEFQLLFPGYCHLYPYPDLKFGRQTLPSWLVRIPVGTPDGAGGCTTCEQRLLITLVGDGAFAPNGRSVRLFPGRSALLFASAHARDLADKMSEHLQKLEAPTFSQSKLYQDAQRRGQAHTENVTIMTDILYALLANSGGIIAGHGENCVITADLPLVGHAFLHINHKEPAIKIAEFLLKMLGKYGYLPLCCSPIPPFTATEETGREKAFYPTVCLFFLALIEKGVRPSLRQTLQKSIERLINMTVSECVEGEIGFSGFEFPMRRGEIAKHKLLYGNALATAEWILLGTHVPKKRAKEAIDTAKSHLDGDFHKTFASVADVHRIGRYRLPAVVYGACSACQSDPYVGWLTRSKFASYLCPHCLAEGKREWIDTRNDPFLPGAYATYLHLLYKAGILNRNHFCRDLERCAEMALIEDACPSFYDLALLCAVLSETGSPNYTEALQKLDYLVKTRTRSPFYAAEAAAYLLAQRI